MTILTCAWLYVVFSHGLLLAVKIWARATGRDCTALFAWYDIWVGVFWDVAKRRLYVFPLPMVGVVVQFPRQTKSAAPVRMAA